MPALSGIEEARVAQRASVSPNTPSPELDGRWVYLLRWGHCGTASPSCPGLQPRGILLPTQLIYHALGDKARRQGRGKVSEGGFSLTWGAPL